jgi:hypothetical protein
MVEIRFERSQLDDALKVLGPNSDKTPFLMKLLSVFNTIIIAIAAVWALWLSFEFDRKGKELIERQQRMALDQATVSLAQQKLTLEQSRVLKDTEIARAELSKRALELDNVIKDLTIHEAREGRISGSAGLTLRQRAAGDLTDAVFRLRLVNTAKTKVEISWILVQWFLGHRGEAAQPDFVRVNPPSSGLQGREPEGPILWKQSGYKGYLYPETRVAEYLKKLTGLVFEPGGPTKVLLPGDSAGFEQGFQITRRSDNWIGFVASVGIDGGYSGHQLFKYVSYCDMDSPQTTCDSETKAGS